MIERVAVEQEARRDRKRWCKLWNVCQPRRLALMQSHPHHSSARPVIERIKAGRDQGFVGAHSLAETYAVLTRLHSYIQCVHSPAGPRRTIVGLGAMQTDGPRRQRARLSLWIL